MRRGPHVLSTVLLTAFMAFAPPPTGASSAARGLAQCKGTDVPVNKQIRFARGRTTAVIRDTIKLCTSHDYHLKARRGQTMSVHLVAGKKTSFTVDSPSDRLADGVKDWEGELPEDGEYQIILGTDATARYTLEVTIR